MHRVMRKKEGGLPQPGSEHTQCSRHFFARLPLPPGAAAAFCLPLLPAFLAPLPAWRALSRAAAAWNSSSDGSPGTFSSPPAANRAK